MGRIARKRMVIETCSSCEGIGLTEGPAPRMSSPCSPRLDVDVAIVGCGIAGAALALALQQRGVSVKVFERDTTFCQRKQGYGLTMQQGAIALARLGIPLAGTTSLSHVSFLPDGNVIGCYGRELDERASIPTNDSAMIQKSHKLRHNIQIPRQRLRAVLVHRLERDLVQWDSKFDSYSEFDDHVEINFANRSSVKSRVLVGADGIFSLVRSQKYAGPHHQLRYLGVVVILGITNAKIDSLHRRVTQTLDGETRIFTMPFTSSADPLEETDVVIDRAAFFDQERFPPQTDVVMWQLSFRCDRDVATLLGKMKGEELKKEALQRCGGWHHPIPQLLEKTEPQDITGYPAYDRHVIEDFSAGLGGEQSWVTVIGDAAHSMSPFKGQGANQALVDSISLARHLSSLFGPYRTAGTDPSMAFQTLRRFETEMSERAGSKVELSRKAADFLHSQDALTVANCVRSAESFEHKAKRLTEQTDEARRQAAKKLFEDPS